MKILVKTTGSFMLMAPGQVSIEPLTPTVINPSAFVETRLAMGQLTLLGQLKDEATQTEMLAYLKDSENEGLAVAAFLSAFGLNPEPVVVVEPELPLPPPVVTYRPAKGR